MNVAVAFVIGVIIGWAAKWVFDTYVSKQDDSRLEAIRAELSLAEVTSRQLQIKLDDALRRKSEVIVKEKDRLEKIKGIGAVFATRFNEAGVHSFADLANLNPERAREIINPQDWQAIDPEHWISEAKQFLSQQQQN